MYLHNVHLLLCVNWNSLSNQLLEQSFSVQYLLRLITVFTALNVKRTFILDNFAHFQAVRNNGSIQLSLNQEKIILESIFFRQWRSIIANSLKIHSGISEVGTICFFIKIRSDLCVSFKKEGFFCFCHKLCMHYFFFFFFFPSKQGFIIQLWLS